MSRTICEPRKPQFVAPNVEAWFYIDPTGLDIYIRDLEVKRTHNIRLSWRQIEQANQALRGGGE